MRDGQITRPVGRISTIAEINEARANSITQDLGYRGDEPRRTWEGDGPFRPDPGINPIAAAVVVVEGLKVTVDASKSFDPDKQPISDYSWNWGDGTANGTTAKATHTYSTAGSKNITLLVTDVTGETGDIVFSVNLVAPVVP